MATIFICGHGAWQVKDGYVTLPANTTMKFYTQNSKWMNSNDVFKLIQGTFTGPVRQECRPFKTCPNMRVFPDDPEYKAYS
ncbi:MAG: putative adhesin [Bryobacteraceae bacterium]